MNFQSLLSEFLKDNLKFKKSEFILINIVFLYLLIFKFLINPYLSKNDVAILATTSFIFLLIENYITTSIYYGIKTVILDKNLITSDIFKKGIYFFPRILLYKVLLGFSILFLFTLASGLIDVLKTTSILISSIIFGMIIAWVSIPFYFLFLSVFAPLIIIFDDSELFFSIKRSFIFMRENLKDIVILGFILSIIWIGIYYFSKETSFFASLKLKVYNIKNLLAIFLFSYLMATLEIYTVKVFMSYYLKRSENEHSI